MRGVKCIAVVVAALAAMVVGLPAAGANTTWTKVSTDSNANIVVPSLGLNAGTPVVAWTQQTSPSTTDINTVSFTTSPTQDVIGAVASKAAEGWAQVDFTHALFTPPGGGIALAFSGFHSTNSTDPLIGLFTTVRNADGSWAPPFVVSSSSGDPWSAVSAGGIPWIATSGTVGIELFNGLIAHAPGAFDQNLQTQPGYQPKLAYDSAGHLWIAWYSNATGATGIYVQQLDPATAAPIGAPARAPGSESVNNNSFGTALTCSATCRLVYGDSPPAGPTDAVVSWWPGQAAPTTVANLAGTGQSAGRVVTAAYRADGRLWVAWWDSKTYRATLGDATGAGGEAQDAGRPKGAPNGSYALAGMAVGDNLLLAANYAWKDPSSADENRFAIFLNTIAPPAPVTKAPGPRDVTLQTTPGGKDFRISVQYTLPKACTPKTPCTLRSELRTRTGRRLYAATPLPGDTKLVLGTRSPFAVPKAAKGKIRFSISVSKAQLLKAPFSTEGGSRVAETRLRVWYTPKGSNEALSVRDGRIKVSIARIKSGALPGLIGIL